MASLLLTWPFWAILYFLHGCVVPIAPDFQDPPQLPNYYPYFENSDPIQESLVSLSISKEDTYIFSVNVGDQNLDDTLFVRWVADYPTYAQNVTKLLQEGMLRPPMPRMEVRQGKVLQFELGCANFDANMQQHRLFVIVADRPFAPPGMFGLLRYHAVTTADGLTYPISAGWAVTCNE